MVTAEAAGWERDFPDREAQPPAAQNNPASTAHSRLDREKFMDGSLQAKPAAVQVEGRRQAAKGDGERADRGYFCQVRFLWRLARSALRRLCLLIFALRRFFSEPIGLLFAQ